MELWVMVFEGVDNDKERSFAARAKAGNKSRTLFKRGKNSLMRQQSPTTPSFTSIDLYMRRNAPSFEHKIYALHNLLRKSLDIAGPRHCQHIAKLRLC
jgi:hypothetical protein